MGRRWLWLLIAAGVCTQTALNVVRPVLSYKLIALGADGTTIGLVTAAYAVLHLFVALSLGRLTDRTPRLRLLIQVAAVVLGVGGVLAAVSGSVVGVALGSVFLGLGHLVFTISGQAAIARYSRDRDLDLGFGWFTAAYSFGQTIGPLIGGALVGSGSVAQPGRIGAINTALAVGTIVALAAVPVMAIPAVLPASRSTAGKADSDVRPRASIAQILRVPGVSASMLTSLTLLSAMDILIAFLPVVGERAGVSPVVIGWLLAVRGATGILSRSLLPWISARISRQRLLAVSALGAAVGLAISPLVINNWLVSGVALAVGGFFLGLGQPITMTLISTAVPSIWRSQALAVRLMGNRVGQVGFPLVAGLVATPFGPAGAIWMSCLALVASVAQQLHTGGSGHEPR
ncbi:Major facilitator superfamily MFS_1 [Nostocoides australiense Ben110]|uniref:Major facilitator superfamily MFS_1 n=1 Tax=Nostocoides australiense Ben110 TaxID=1193182 RepID=W6K2M1_9MICO|nr:MFS transporter [Tetrasphaera australiensis]CCH75401.1 Major facilitator superfamily MFS_1 [Tetrasphaera australiensis Ben110]